jgi:hypothetical protein
MGKGMTTGLPILIASITFGYLFVVSFLVGFVASKHVAGKSEKERGRLCSLIIPFGKWNFHLHHWLYSVGLLSFTSATGVYLLNPPITYGLLGGLVFQGIYCYNDWHRIIVKKVVTSDLIPKN